MTLKSNCDKFGGKIINGKCKIDGFTMSKADFLFDFSPKTQQHRVMTPQEFLDITPPTRLTSPKQRKPLKERIRGGKEVDPAFIDVDVDTCQVLSHEGRNRAIASKELGLKKYPVVVYNQEFDKDAKGMFGTKGLHFKTERKNKCKKFKRQKF